MIGDGISDLDAVETTGGADIFICYGKVYIKSIDTHKNQGMSRHLNQSSEHLMDVFQCIPTQIPQHLQYV